MLLEILLWNKYIPRGVHECPFEAGVEDEPYLVGVILHVGPHIGHELSGLHHTLGLAQRFHAMRQVVGPGDEPLRFPCVRATTGHHDCDE